MTAIILYILLSLFSLSAYYPGRTAFAPSTHFHRRLLPTRRGPGRDAGERPLAPVRTVERTPRLVPLAAAGGCTITPPFPALPTQTYRR